jgi:hypothetical protein
MLNPMSELAEGHPLFTYLIITGANPEFKTFLDIGTGSGMGTTRALFNGISQRTDNNARMYSIDINEPAIHKARFQYTNNRKWLNASFLQFIWGRFNKQEFLLRQDLEDMPNPAMIRPIYDLMYDREHHLWLKAPFISLNEKFDVIVLDGGDFSSVGDFSTFKSAEPKIWVLIDVNLCKNKEAFAELSTSSKYVLLMKFEEGRGSAIFKRKNVVTMDTVNVDYTKFLHSPADFWLL